MISILLMTSLLFWAKSDTVGKQLLNVSQYIFVPPSSYYQFRLSLAFVGQNKQGQIQEGNFLSQIKQINTSVILGLHNPVQSTLFNMIIIPVKAQNNSFQFYSCYVRAAIEGLSSANCPIQTYTSDNGNCNKCILNGYSYYFPYICTGCTQNVSINVFSNSSTVSNENILFIIDNTNVISQSGAYIQMFLQYESKLDLSIDYEKIIIFFFILLIVLIVIIMAIAIKLTINIKNTQILIKGLNKIQ